jgi:DNA-binding NtrC family response regulator
MADEKPKPFRVLVVDDDPQTLEIVQRNLADAGYTVMAADGVEAALGVLEFRPVDLVVSDIRMPRVGGLDLLHYVRENLPELEIMMMTAYPCIDGAVESIKEGAEAYLAKPFTDAELLAAVEKIADKLRLRRAAHPETPSSGYGIIGQSPGIQRVFSLIRRAAAVPATVLIRGESGTGKELVARAIHHAGDRASAPFVSVNCSAIPDTLLESELFGHQRGAFTGARESRAGYFRLADGGTVFLDEIGDASAGMQARLLRVLQNKEIQVVGERRPRQVDTRIIAATHKTLPDLVTEGLFREDLFYRLNVIDIWVPPLRERIEDIFPLLEAFLRKFCEEMGRTTPEFSDDALQAIRDYAWPGNVRELENVVHRLGAVVDAPEIHLADLPEPLRSPPALPRPARTRPSRTLAEVEAEHIAAALAENQGNKTRTAEVLGIDRKTLRLKLRRLGLE